MLPAPAAAAQAPANDAFAQAQVLPGVPAVVRGSVNESTPEPGEPDHAQAIRTTRSLWYRLTPTETIPVLASTCDTDFDSLLAVYTGASLERLELVGAGDDECGVGSQVAWVAEAGETYHLAVASYPAPRRTGFTLEIEPAPLSPNDAFAAARPMRGPGRVTGTSLLATREFGEPEHDGTGNLHSVWFRFEPQRTERVTIDTLGSAFDTVLAVYQGELGNLDQLAANDDDEEGLTSEVALRVRRGQTYWIALDGLDGQAGVWELGISNGGAAGNGLELAVPEGQDLDRVVSSGLASVVACVRRCRLALEVRVGSGTARRLGLGERPAVLARLEGVVGGTVRALPAVLRLSAEARGALAGEGELTVSLVARLLGTRAPGREVRRVVTLRRATAPL